MRHRVIMTVGTSLVENRGGETGSGCVSSLNTACGHLKERPHEATRVCKVLKELIELDEEEQVNGWRTCHDDGYQDRLPQELSYLYLLLRDELASDDTLDIRLLASSSDLGSSCAEIIRRFVEVRKEDTAKAAYDLWRRVEGIKVIPVEGLQVEDPELFRATGAPNLIEHIHQLAEGGTDDGSRVIINATGGFKELIPYTTIAAALMDRPYQMHYLFSGSTEITTLPPFPIGLDFQLWHREDALRRSAVLWEGYRDRLDPRMQSVAGSESDPAPAQAIFEKLYDRQTQVDPFQEYSLHVVHDLLKGAPDDYATRLERLICDQGPLIWLGDKLPMAAGHASEHHRDLLEVAQLVLLPLIDRCVAKPPDPQDCRFLNAQERFVLLAALLLHDCGHTMDALPCRDGQLVRLFPSEVRSLHHFLSFHRLTKCGADLNWDAEADLAKEVAYLCAYHRRRTGWTNAGEGNSCPYVDMELVPPLQAQSEYGLDTRLDFPKLVALLRLIDGCDNQTRRVGGPLMVEAQQRVFEQDRTTHLAEFRRLASACHDYLTRNGVPPAPGVMCAQEAWQWLNDGCVGDMPGFSPRDRVALATGECADPVWVSLWTALARARDEVQLRDNQYLHSLKHQVVRRISIFPAGDWETEDCELRFELVPEPSLKDELDSEALKERADCKGELGDRTLRKYVLDEVSSEVGKEDDHPQVDYLSARLGVPLTLSFCWSDCVGTPVKLEGNPCGSWACAT
jgi:CRISPR/Cas system-associated protein Csm6